MNILYYIYHVTRANPDNDIFLFSLKIFATKAQQTNVFCNVN